MITASIVTYKNNRTDLGNAIASAVKSSITHIYIVDNSPTDELKEFVTTFERVEYIYGQGNVGYGTAHNIAFKKSIDLGAKYHVVINPDVEFDRSTIDDLSKYMDENQDVGQVMPKVCYPNGEIQLNCKLLPSPMDLILRRFSPFKSWTKSLNERYEMSQYKYDQIAEIPFMIGCFMFCRNEAVAKMRGFDERYFMYCEDIDFCRKIQEIGYKTICYPFTTITHIYEQESHKSFKLLKSHIKSAIQYFNKWGWMFDKRRAVMNSKVTKTLINE